MINFKIVLAALITTTLSVNGNTLLGKENKVCNYRIKSNNNIVASRTRRNDFKSFNSVLQTKVIQIVRDLPKGKHYAGHWANNQPNGRGLMRYRNGEKYIGEWINGVREGMGQYYDKTGKLIYEGNYSNDKPTETFPNRF